MSLAPQVWTHEFQVLKLQSKGTNLQPKTPDYQLVSSEYWRGMLEDTPQQQMLSRLGLEITFSAKMYCQMRDTDSPAEVNDRIRITKGRRPDGSSMIGETFTVVEKGSDAECFDTLYLERLEIPTKGEGGVL